MINVELTPREKVIWDSITQELVDVIEFYVEIYTDRWPDCELDDAFRDHEATEYLLERQIPIWETITADQQLLFLTVVRTFIVLNFEEMRRMWVEDETQWTSMTYTTFAVKQVFSKMKSKLNFKFLTK
tara:strand:+ start:653 stop:1036 length:384 start_codon:yes stop_codon:yes gene_type:complete